MYILKIDNREHKCIALIEHMQEQYFAGLDIKIEIVPLNLGDFSLCKRNKIQSIDNGTEYNDEEIIIYERKSIPDLASSIKDGRYSEQSMRLDSISLHNHNIIYIIEGNIEKIGFGAKYNKMSSQTLYSALTSISLFKGFSVMRTFTITETVNMLLQSVKKIVKELKTGKNLYYNLERNENNQQHMNNLSGEHEHNNLVQKGGITVNIPEYTTNTQIFNTNDVNKNYVNVIKKVKKENITPQNIGEIILSQIPGISTATALAIMSKTKTLRNLLYSLEQDPDYLLDIKMKSKSGSERKISKSAIQSIKTYLLTGIEQDKVILDI